jgi:hypothetical protein
MRREQLNSTVMEKAREIAAVCHCPMPMAIKLARLEHPAWPWATHLKTDRDWDLYFRLDRQVRRFKWRWETKAYGEPLHLKHWRQIEEARVAALAGAQGSAEEES